MAGVAANSLAINRKAVDGAAIPDGPEIWSVATAAKTRSTVHRKRAATEQERHSEGTMLTETNTIDGLDARQLLGVLVVLKNGDFSARMPVDNTGLAGKISDALNEVIELNSQLVAELQRIRKEVGQEGKTKERGALARAAGGWTAAISAVNDLIADLGRPTNEIARVVGAVASGDLRQTVALEVAGEPLKGDFLQTARTVNSMVEQLGTFASEVTRVAREVGTDGKLGGQASIPGVSGTWKELTDSVNIMAFEPDRPGSQHHRGHHRGRQRRPVEEDHGRRSR